MQAIAKYIRKSVNQVNRALLKTPQKEYYLLSSAQRRIYISSFLAGNSTVYNMPLIFKIVGPLDIKKLEDAFQVLVKRHSVLRTRLVEIDGQQYQQVLKAVDLVLQQWDDLEEPEQLYRRFVKFFDFGQAPLMRVALAKRSSEEHWLAIDIHHIICDGISAGILLRELKELYLGQSLPEVNYQYFDYLEWQKGLEQQDEYKQKGEYWKNELRDLPQNVSFPYDYPRPSLRSYRGDTLHYVIERENYQKVLKLSSKYQTTPFTVFMAVLGVILYKYTSQKDLVVGTAVSGRTHGDLEDIVGMFVNVLPIRMTFNENTFFGELIQQVHEKNINAIMAQQYSFDAILRDLNYQVDPRRNPLFDILLVTQDTPFSKDAISFRVGELEFAQEPIANTTAKFDITFEITEIDEQALLKIEYDVTLFRKSSIERIAKVFGGLISRLEQLDSDRLKEIEIVDPEEKQLILNQFNGTSYQFPESTYLQQFLHTVRRNPHSNAITYLDRTITYAELNIQADQIADNLRKSGIGNGAVVGILIEQNIEYIVGMIAVLKVGAAFLPIDPEIPNERIALILSESNAAGLITTKAHLNQNDTASLVAALKSQPGKEKIRVFCLDPNMQLTVNSEKVAWNPTSTPDDPAYVIYTSGTTGKPKGVVITNRSLLNLCYWHNHVFQVTARDRASKYAGVGFDASIWEIFPYLLAGAHLFIVPPEIRHDLVQLCDFFNNHRISIAFLPTQVYEQFREFSCPTLKVMLTGGDRLTKFTPNSYQLFNNYGPTENTVVSTSCLVNQESASIPIGKPIHNVKAYVLDEGNNLLPIGAKGELFLAGANLAQGYINLEELTTEKFLDNPFMPGEKMYRTGDEVRWLENGNLEFCGRKDGQIKLRGYRIETAEIELALKRIPEVTDAALVLKTDSNGDQYLCAFVTSEQKLVVENLKNELKRTLPLYMIPTIISQLPEMPINPNGKIDRKALSSLPVEFQSKQSLHLPQNETEKAIAAIWNDVLGVKHDFGIDQTFFEVGGNSLKLIQVLTKVNKLIRTRKPLTLQAFLEQPTIQAMARYMVTGEPTVDQKQSLVFNESGNKIFCFPSILGDFSEYQVMAEHITDYSFHCFRVNYYRAVETDGYVDYIIKNRQENKPLILIGYSAGGVLAFTVAQVLEEKGITVSGIILIDSYIINSNNYTVMMDYTLQKGGCNGSLFELEEYLNYFTTINYNLPVKANIYNIKSNRVMNQSVDLNADWQRCTTGLFKLIQGHGDHQNMLSTPHIYENAQLIMNIIKSLGNSSK